VALAGCKFKQVALLSQRGRAMLRVCQLLASIVQNVEQSYSLLVTYATDLSMLFCCLWRNVETSCHKHFVVFSRHQQTPPLTTSEVSQLARRWSDGVVLITPGR